MNSRRRRTKEPGVDTGSEGEEVSRVVGRKAQCDFVELQYELVKETSENERKDKLLQYNRRAIELLRRKKKGKSTPPDLAPVERVNKYT
jgi:hypothetical protein